MIDIKQAKEEFQKFLNNYKDNDDISFKLKVNHTYHVLEVSKTIANNLNLSEEDINLAELIGLLHDIGRFDELNFFKKFDNANFDHASYGVKMLFEDNLIRRFIKEDNYDEIIKTAIIYHNKYKIQDRLNERSLLHSKIIRDSDKLDIFRVTIEEEIEAIFPGNAKDKEDLEKSFVSNKIFETIKNKACVDIHDRKTALDYLVCILAFVFDLNFKESYQILKDKNYINIIIDRFKFHDLETRNKMQQVRNIINEFIDSKLK